MRLTIEPLVEYPKMNLDQPPLPSSVEDVFLSVGPAAFRFLVQAVGTQTDASLICGVSVSTLSRWIDTEPGDPFGRRGARSWRPSWFGYPAPFPGFDRVCEKVCGRGYWNLLEWRGRVFESSGSVFKSSRSTSRVFLGGLLDNEQILLACRELGVPDSTRLRWMAGLPWPSQWVALDRLALEVVEKGWAEFVLSYDSPGRKIERLPAEGLRCLLVTNR